MVDWKTLNVVKFEISRQLMSYLCVFKYYLVDPDAEISCCVFGLHSLLKAVQPSN